MKNITKKIFSILLVLAMIVSVIPAALAAPAAQELNSGASDGEHMAAAGLKVIAQTTNQVAPGVTYDRLISRNAANQQNIGCAGKWLRGYTSRKNMLGCQTTNIFPDKLGKAPSPHTLGKRPRARRRNAADRMRSRREKREKHRGKTQRYKPTNRLGDMLRNSSFIDQRPRAGWRSRRTNAKRKENTAATAANRQISGHAGKSPFTTQAG